MKWFFSPQIPSQVETEVTQRDQFSNDEVQLSETIVRESIQNSLDAADNDQSQVSIVFRWVDKSHGLTSDFMRKIVDDQLVHARAAGLNIDGIAFDDPVALLIEDFGTKGLTGSINTKDNDNFSDFWRRHGKSHKTGKSRGRWGLGKLVYSTTSQLGIFFGATLRKDDTHLLVMGQTVLNLREVDGQQYPPHGFFADTEGDDLLTKIPVPLVDEDLVEQFRDQFSLSRGDRPGLSVMIPFPNPDFNQAAMMGVAIVNYFYPIITDQLLLQFNEERIDRNNIRTLAHEHTSQSFTDIDVLFDFIEEVRATRNDVMLELKPSWANDQKLGEDDFEEADLEVIRRRFSNGDLVALHLPVTLKKKDGTSVQTRFSVFIKRPPELRQGLDLYVRGGLTLPGEAKFRDRKALGAMIADEDEICSFLGDAENAAHTQWIGSAEKLKKNYKNPAKTIKVIKHAVVQLYDLLAEVEEEIDEQALQDFFGIEEPEDAAKTRKRKKKSPLVIPPPPVPRPKDFNISKNEDGFTVSTTSSASEDHFPQNIRIDVAYDVNSGNPWKKYSPLDFKMSVNGSIALGISKKTGSVTSRKDNVLMLEVKGIPFKLVAKGFDKNRDLKIKLVKES
ncbi:MAG: hypothetical protein ACE5FQ_01360 [Thiogranum sp.]